MDMFQELQGRIQARTALIGVIGLGYVGLPMGVRAARAGFPVLGFDVEEERVASLNAARSYIGDVSSPELHELIAAERFAATTDYGRIAACDIIIICVPTPLNDYREPDLSYIEAAATGVANTLRPGQLVILESTTWPGTTEEVLQPRFAAHGLSVGVDYFLAFSPERIDPGHTGSQGYTVENTPKVVGGITEPCTQIAALFYRQIVNEVVEISSPRAAEMTKLFENIFRNVNIALVNELAMLCDRMGLNVWEIIDAAATKPFAFMKHTPGPGLGGHCIPLDPFYLNWKAREYDFQTRFIELAGEINMAMPYHVQTLIVRALNRHRKSLNGSLVVLLGVAYKRDIADYRESPVFKIMDLIEAGGAEVVTVDPHIETFASHRGRIYSTTPLSDDLLHHADCVVFITDHSAFPVERIVREAALVVDTRNATKHVREGREKIVLL
jgi:UDP-N-acetyl-D-glucosamine dehydrogenase